VQNCYAIMVLNTIGVIMMFGGNFMKRLVFILFLGQILHCYGQENEPLTMIKEALSCDNVEQSILKISTPNIVSQLNSIDLNSLRKLNALDLISINDSSAIVNLSVNSGAKRKDSLNVVYNYYFFLIKQDRWVIEDIKTSNVIYQYNLLIIDSLGVKDDLEPMQKWLKHNAHFGLSSDYQLKQFFIAYKSDFEKMFSDAEMASRKKNIKFAAIEKVDSIDNKSLLYKHGFTYSSILRDDCGCIAFVISDFYNRRVGFIKFSDSKKKEKFGYKRFVFPIDLGDGWFVFRGKI
jgi:hypothetical protein